MAHCLNDRQVIAAIGADALAGAGFNAEQVKKWRLRGIPWRLRAIVADMARRKRVALPPDFLSERIRTLGDPPPNGRRRKAAK